MPGKVPENHRQFVMTHSVSIHVSILLKADIPGPTVPMSEKQSWISRITFLGSKNYLVTSSNVSILIKDIEMVFVLYLNFRTETVPA